MPSVKFTLELGKDDEKPVKWEVTLDDAGPIIIDPALSHTDQLEEGLHRVRMVIQGSPGAWARLTINRPNFLHNVIVFAKIATGASDAIVNRGFRV